jgi:hypothetical protein
VAPALWRAAEEAEAAETRPPATMACARKRERCRASERARTRHSTWLHQDERTRACVRLPSLRCPEPAGLTETEVWGREDEGWAAAAEGCCARFFPGRVARGGFAEGARGLGPSLSRRSLFRSGDSPTVRLAPPSPCLWLGGTCGPFWLFQRIRHIRERAQKSEHDKLRI